MDIPYTIIEGVIEDEVSENDIQLQLDLSKYPISDLSNKPTKVPSRIYLEINNKDNFLKNLKNCLLSYHMEINHKPFILPHLKKKIVSKKVQHSIPTLIQPFNNTKVINLLDYLFFVPKPYQEQSFRGGERSFFNPISENHLRVVILPKKKMASENLIETMEMDAMQYIRNHVSTNYYVTRRHNFIKRMNLSDELSLWTGYFLLLYFPNKNSAHLFLMLRKMFSPPLANVCQDIYITIETKNLSETKLSEYYKELDLIGSSFRSMEKNFYWIDLIKGEIDLLKGRKCKWDFCKKLLKIQPKYVENASSYYFSLLNIYTKIPKHQNINTESFKDYEPFNIPSDAIYPIFHRPSGLSDLLTELSSQKSNHEAAELLQSALHTFEFRMVDYLVYHINTSASSTGFYFPDMLESLKENSIVDSSPLSPNDIEILQKEFLWLLHLRDCDFVLPYDPNFFKSVIMDWISASVEIHYNPLGGSKENNFINIISNNLMYNSDVLLFLIEYNYLRDIVFNKNTLHYFGFLCLLLIKSDSFIPLSTISAVGLRILKVLEAQSLVDSLFKHFPLPLIIDMLINKCVSLLTESGTSPSMAKIALSILLTLSNRKVFCDMLVSSYRFYEIVPQYFLSHQEYRLYRDTPEESQNKVLLLTLLLNSAKQDPDITPHMRNTIMSLLVLLLWHNYKNINDSENTRVCLSYIVLTIGYLTTDSSVTYLERYGTFIGHAILYMLLLACQSSLNTALEIKVQVSFIARMMFCLGRLNIHDLPSYYRYLSIVLRVLVYYQILGLQDKELTLSLLSLLTNVQSSQEIKNIMSELQITEALDYLCKTEFIRERKIQEKYNRFKALYS